MSRSILLHICLAFCSLLFFNFATRCLAFPKMERREIVHADAEKGQTERMNTDDQEYSSIPPKHMPQLVFSEDPTIASEGPSATPLNRMFPISKETYPTGAGLLQSNSPDLHTAPELEVPASEEVFGSRHPEKVSPESRLSKAMLPIVITAAASLNIDEKEEPFSSTSVQPIVDGTTEAAQGFLKYMDNQLIATQSQEGVHLGYSPSSYIHTKEILTSNPRTEKFEADTEQRMTSLPGMESTADTEPDEEKPSQMTADNTQATATKLFPTTSKYALSVEPETDSLLRVPEATVSVSTAVPTASVLSDEWDDTKLESINQIRTSQLRDNAETQARTEPSQMARESHDSSTEGGHPSTEAAEVALGLPEGETLAHMGTTLLIAPEGERSAAFTPTRPMEDMEVSVASMLQSTGDVMESTKESGAIFFSETTVSISEYESEAYQSLGDALKDIITQEMTTAVQEPEATLPLVTQEQVATLEVATDSGEPGEGKESSSPSSDIADITQLFRDWESLATTASTTAILGSLEVTPAVEDLMETVTGPDEEFTPVLSSPVTPPGITVVVPSISPVLPASEASSERMVSSISHPNTATSYSLDQLESEEGEEDEDEEDEDEDEEEEDEEEDEEDKDADSLDESFDGDTELPGFTVPGVTSQEPGLAQGHMDPLEGATYQVPDAIEWEQQNQGLVRSWMEKLKDKAGYMSGMLVPVGVGIAGALFILGALYSIKVMNRRRRNGFKRHKRKQREFNSMQDRVMLLADSSEDEF